MTPEDVFVKDLERFLDRRAGTVHAAYLAETLEATSSTSQRPWWSSPERWLPMDLTLRPPLLQAPRITRLLLAVAALVALLVLTALNLGVGRPHLPPPFGVARNGTLAVSADGDVFTIDPGTGQRTTLVGGSTFDFGPTFSRDGTKLIFLRAGPNDCGMPDCGLSLAVADADGANARLLTSPLAALDWQDWSPDGRQIAILAAAPDGPGHVIQVVQADGSGSLTLDTGQPAHEVWWRPPAGTEIIFRGEHLAPTDPMPAILAIRPDGTGLRTISRRPAVDEYDFQGLSVSPDGRLVAYHDTGPDQRFRVHIMDIETGADRVLPKPTDSAELGAIFGPDGRSVAYLRWSPVDGQVRIVVAPTDGSSEGIELGPGATFGTDGPTINNYVFSADGQAVLANYDAEQVARLLPTDGSTPVVLAHGEAALAGYQRLAP